MDQRTERIVIETERHRLVGDLVLPRGGHRSRLSDFLNAGAPEFVSLTDAIVEESGAEGRRLEFVAVAVAQITLAYPAPVDGS